MERIAATRRWQLARGEYFEAVRATATLLTPTMATDTATSAVAPIQSMATVARPVQMLLF